MEPKHQTILAPSRFTFTARQSFLAAYRNQPVPPEGYTVVFAQTEFIDTAGLGLLLQLREYAGRRELVRCTQLRPELRQLLSMADFEALVVLEGPRAAPIAFQP